MTLFNRQYGARSTAGALLLLLPAIAACGQNSPKEDKTMHESRATVSAEDTVDALNGVFGKHAKTRGSHAKGFCIKGEFTPAESEFTDIPLFGNGVIPITGRFSLGGGNPEASDKSRGVRGVALRFNLPAGDVHDLVMISAPIFFASTPEQFVEFLKVRTADPTTGEKNPAKIAEFNEANPNVMPHLNYVSQTAPSASYASSPYFSTHAFLFGAEDSDRQAARWVFKPSGGFVGLTAAEEDNFPDDFLEAELNKRLAKGPAEWDAFLQKAQNGDDVTDPSAEWASGDDNFVKVGQLKISQTIESGSNEDCTGQIFDPNNLTAGIEATDDPILKIRRPAYAVSFGRRVAD